VCQKVTETGENTTGDREAVWSAENCARSIFLPRLNFETRWWQRTEREKREREREK